jgi:hypothetical protein
MMNWRAAVFGGKSARIIRTLRSHAYQVREADVPLPSISKRIARRSSSRRSDSICTRHFRRHLVPEDQRPSPQKDL